MEDPLNLNVQTNIPVSWITREFHRLRVHSLRAPQHTHERVQFQQQSSG